MNRIHSHRHSDAACVVGVKAPYNHGVPLAGADRNPVSKMLRATHDIKPNAFLIKALDSSLRWDDELLVVNMENQMNHYPLLKRITKLGLLLMMGVGMSACSKSTFTWKEEVLLHDGKKLIVEMSDSYDSSMNHEIGQGAPLAEHKTTFTIPGTNQTVIWKSDNRSLSDPDYLILLALDFLDGVPYVATTAVSCHTYNKWGRPNPPYVFFKYDGKAWQHIPLEEFPEKFTVNTSSSFQVQEKQKVNVDIQEYGFVRAETVAKFISAPGMSKHYHSILRTPIKNEMTACPEFE